MNYRELGSTKVKVSVIGIGGWQIGGPDKSNGVGHGWGNVNDKESTRVIYKAEELGVNLIDTADIYGNGHSERIIGRALKGRREKWIIATKGGLLKTPGKRGQFFNGSAEHIRTACETSLIRLKTNTIDFYQLHGMPNESQIQATMEELSKLKEEGKIRFYGISTGNRESIIKLQKYGPIDIVQIGFSLINSQEESAIDYCYKNKIGTLIRTPLSWGAAFGRYAVNKVPEFEFGDNRHGADINQILKDHKKGLEYAFLWGKNKRTPAQAALRFVLDKKGVTAAIPGTRTIDHLIDNAGAAECQELTKIEKNIIKQIKSNS